MLPVRNKNHFTSWLILFFAIVINLHGEDSPEIPSEPEILSISPLGGQQGSSFETEILGQALAGARGVWIDCRELQGKIVQVTEINLDEAGKESIRPGHRVKLQVAVDRKAVPGAHRLRLVTPRGMSNAMTLHISREKVMSEAETGPHTLGKAQPLSLPLVINGQISKRGEADYFSFQAKRGQKVLFEVHSGSGILDPQLTLFEAAGSWFDPNQLTRLGFNDEVVSHSPTSSAGLTYRFHKKGRYLARVSEFQGHGGLNYSYQLRVVNARRLDLSPTEDVTLQLAAHTEPVVWRERNFDRKLESNRLDLLWSRTVNMPAVENVSGKGDLLDRSRTAALDSTRLEAITPSAFTGVLTSVKEGEINETPEQALGITLPVIVEGAIEYPGDIDYFEFEVQAGEKLAFEIETPDVRPPDFNPRLGVLDSTGKEMFSNVSMGKVKIQAKTIETFETGGKYTLQIRDLTSRYGQAGFAYRVLLRPQIPHVGRIEVQVKRLNLAAGDAGKLTIITEQEEGFVGEIAIGVENLPSGVEAYPGTEVKVKKPPPVNRYEDEKRFVPGSQAATVLLIAGADARGNEMPRFAQVKAWPVIKGRPGKPFFVAKIPIMVVSPIQTETSRAFPE